MRTTTKSRPTPATVFTHLPVAPYVPSEIQHAFQRYFSRSGSNGAYSLSLAGYHKRCDRDVTFEVYRIANNDYAEVISHIRIREGGESTLRLNMTAAELRHCANLLLDAAHDLDTHSALSLTTARAA